MRNLSTYQCLPGFLFILLPIILFSQKSNPHWACGTDLTFQRAMQNPDWLKKHEHQEQSIYNSFSAKVPAMAGKSMQLVTLPVAVHIVHDNGPENISDAQVLVGIQQLNEAFANMAYYDQGTGMNTMIQFCLARRTPDGTPASGITRNQSTLTNMALETDDISLKNLSRWNPKEYINIWLVREICSASSGCGVVGYAYFPASHGNPEDGIVMESEYLGATPGGTGVLAHEIGHYLGLYHTFQGGCENDDCLTDGDRVCDTPPDQSTLWVPCNSVVNTCNTDAQSGFASDQPDMILNFMDYTDFGCFNDFTSGQSDRMHWYIDNVRFSLLESLACQDPCPNPIMAFFTASATTINVGQTVTFTNGSTNAATYSWKVNGTAFANGTDASYTFNTSGTFTISLMANSNNPAFCNSEVFEQVVDVICPVVADFGVDTEAPNLGSTVTIINQSQNATQYEWFLNGVSQGATFTSFTPASTGVYVIRLEASNGFCKQIKLIYLSVQDACMNATFQKTWGDADGNEGLQTITLSDGNSLLAGTTINNGEDDIYLLKIDPTGATVWQKRFGRTGNGDYPRQLLALADGGWMLAGTIPAGNGTTNPFLARFASDGTVLWQQKINTPGAVNAFTDIILAQDGNLLVSGAIHSNNASGFAGMLMKISLTGNIIWSNLYDASGTDWIEGIRELPNGDIVAAGFTLSFGQNLSSIHDGMVMRLSPTGALLWVYAYGTSENEGLSSIYATSDGGLMALGSSSGWNGAGGGTYQDDTWMMKLSGDGALQWSQVFQSNLNIDLACRDAYQNTDGSYIFSANDIGSNGSDFSVFFKASSQGDIEWSRVYTSSGQSRITSVDATSGGYIFTGSVTNGGSKDIWFLKTDEAGRAGVCPDVSHQISKLAVLPVVTLGALNILPAPTLSASDLLANDIALTESIPCAPDCIDEQDCEDTWIKTIGIPGVVEGGNNIIRAMDGNFYLDGYRGDSILLIKMTPDGLILWTRTFKFTSGIKENISEIIEDSDGNLVGAGLCTTTQYRGFAFKYNPSTDQVIWAHEAPLSPQTFYVSLLERSPGGNYLASISHYNSPSPGYGEDANMVEIDRNTGLYSGIKWAFSLASGNSESINEMQIKNGNIYTVGRYTYGLNDSGMRGSVSKFDLSGNEIWSRMALTGPSPQAKVYAPDFVFDGDNMVTVYYGDFSGASGLTEQFAVSKSDLNGNLIWSKLYTIAGFPELFVQSIISVSDGYVIMTPNVSGSQPGSVFLIKIDKNGLVLWARSYEDMDVFHGEKFLATANDYLYFIASHSLGDIVVAKLRLSDGLIGDSCQFTENVTVSVQNMAPVFNPVSLLRYPAPITQSTRTAIPHAQNLSPVNLCLTVCGPEICNNGLDDDGDGLFDCLDPDCNCNGCDGEQTRFWYFGDGGGLDFSTDPPTVLADGQTLSREASSVATDMMGNLLFYTDAGRLYTRTHTLMPNGNNLDGHVSTTQTLILPQPDSPWRLFVFTPNSFENLASGKGLSYSIVNMSLNGSLGDVEIDQKNIELLPQSQFTEKITATRHCNGKDWWILVKERNNNTFRAYPFTASGIGIPIISSVGTISTVVAPNVIGCLKFSPNGKRLANTLFHTGGFDLFDFDNSTGLLSNAVSITNPLMAGAYGLEFSSDDQVMYLSNLIAPSHIWQFDPHAGDAIMIAQSTVMLAGFSDDYRFGQLQRASNGKIYVTNTFPLQFTNGIGVIHSPEVLGTGCLYQQEGLNIAPGGANLGLPSFPQDFLPKSLFLAIEGMDSLCQTPGNLSFNLNINDRCALDSVRWTLVGTGTIVSQTNEGVEINFAQAGTTILVATAFSECATTMDTLQIEAFENNTPLLDLGPDAQVCENGVQVLDAGSGFYQYRWNDGSTESTLTTLFPGTYWVDVWDACGNQQSDTVHISVFPSTILDLGADRTICSNATLTYTLPPAFTSWTWTPTAGLSCSDCETIEVSPHEATTYIVIASNEENCLSADTLTILFATDTIFTNLDTFVCSNETLLLFGQELPADTAAIFYSNSAGGCDSVLTVTVLGLDPVQTFIEEFICPGDTLLTNNVQVTSDTTLQFLLTRANGCDSLVQVTVTLLESPTKALTLEACPGSSAIYNGVEIPVGETRIIRVPPASGGACDSTLTITTIATLAPTVQLPATDTLEAGSSIQLDPIVSGMGPFLWQWAPAPPPDWLSCYECPNPIAAPLATILYTVTVTDTNGCEAHDSTRLVVLPCAELYAPNVFSPNNDGTNDWFYLLSSDCPIRIRYLRIFSRWGGLMFERTDFSANVETLGWDGRLKGRPLTSNVFVWVAEIEFPDGSVLLKKGDVTLLR